MTWFEKISLKWKANPFNMPWSTFRLTITVSEIFTYLKDEAPSFIILVESNPCKHFRYYKIWNHFFLVENQLFHRSKTEIILYERLKGATILYFMHYLCLVIILFITDLHKPVFSIYFFKTLFFFCVLCLICFELEVIFIGFL